MLTFDKFTGINNVLPSEKLAPTELATALNVDINLAGQITRRSGYTITTGCSKNLWQADGFKLATSNNDLIKVGGATLYPSLGVTRVWYCNLPDGRTTFSNGLINGITDGTTTTGWGVPIPAAIGSLTPVAGDLNPGGYQYRITYIRTSDGLEGGPLYSNPIEVLTGGVFLSGLPALSGYSINVYLSSQDGGVAYYAGNTANGLFTFTGKNSALTLPCRTDNLLPAPVGTITAFWRGRTLVADGSVLYASRPQQVELFDLRRDFKQFSDNITLVQPVDDGVYIGTATELAFLSGTEFDKLVYQKVIDGATVLGSGVTVDGKLIKIGDGTGSGTAMVCISDGVLVAGLNGGQILRMTEGRYTTTATEVAATFRMPGGIPQYLAVPQ